MSRMPRIDIPKTIYHIISRGNNKKNIFLDEKDYAVFLKYLKETLEEKGFLLYCYCLMPNHFHLLIETRDTPLSKIMQKLLTRYAVYFNSRHKQAGHVFQDRYKSKICDKEDYLFKLIQYIHINPLRAGITKDLNNYKWSSHLVLAGKINNKNLSLEKLFRYMDCNSIAEGHKAYNSLMKEFVEGKTWQIKHLTLDEILQKISTETKIPKNDILANNQDKKTTLARKKFSYLAANDFGYALKEIAGFIHRDMAVVSRHISEIRKTLNQ